MTSRFSRLSVLMCLLALTSAVLVPSSAEAKAKPSKAGIVVNSSKVAVYPDGGTIVHVTCRNTKKDCRGTARYALVGGGAGAPAAAVSYFMKRGRSGYIQVNVSASQQKPAGLGPANALGANVELRESKPFARTVLKNVSLERAQASRILRGTVTGTADPSLTDVKVNALERRGTRLVTIASVPLPSGTGAYSFGAQPIGNNNSAVTDLYLTISGKVNGVDREWFWRGNESGGFESGTKSDFTATHVAVGSGAADFIANFGYGTVRGTVSTDGSSPVAGTKITVAGAPIGMPGLQSVQKNLDFPYCAESYGSETVTGTTYSIPFIPRIDGDKRYAIEAEPASGAATTLWNNDFGSCIHARESAFGTAYLLAFPGAGDLVFNPALKTEAHNVTGQVVWPGYGPWAQDQQVDIRSFIPGESLLSMPVVARTVTDGAGNFTVPGLPPGTYHASVGRQQTCHAWYPSKYTNNKTYLSGVADRGTEAWKAFRILNSLPAAYRNVALAHGATDQQNHLPGGTQGWMFRDYCRSMGAGVVAGFNLGGSDVNLGTLTDSYGATITGKVKRYKGKTSKEMMVSAYSTQGYLVGRSTISASNGSFTIRGLASGNYNIVVNTDSWRGLGRTHKGAHTKRVVAGRGYSVGTLRPQF